MNNSMQYVIKQGDTLYNIAKRYDTTVPIILSKNTSIDPQNLKIGSSIAIYPGKNMMQSKNSDR